MTAPVITLADDLTAALNAETWSQELTAARGYLPRANRANDSYQVTVTPRTVDTEIESREAVTDTYAIDVAVLRLVPSSDPDGPEGIAQIDALVALTDEIKAWMQFRHFGQAKWSGVSAVFLSPEALDNDLLFQSVITATYTLYRRRA